MSLPLKPGKHLDRFCQHIFQIFCLYILKPCNLFYNLFVNKEN